MYINLIATYFCCLATISYQFYLGGDATFCNEVVFCLPYRGGEHGGQRGQLPLHFARWGAVPPTFYLLLL